MRLSTYFLPLLKETPANAEIISHQLMLKSGMVRQQSSGIYTWLPLGLKVLKNIEKLVRECMDESGAQEVLMPCIQSAKLWHESGRYDSYGEEMLKITDRHENDLLFGPTNEEVITDIFRNNVKSYKELPKNLYQIQWKFRDEIRPRFGVMRGREFLMKDAYSFDLNEEGAIATYDLMFKSYIKLYKSLGLKNIIPARADTGAIGGNLSHEFHILSPRGESDIFYDAKIEVEIAKDEPNVEMLKSAYAVADDMHDPEKCSVKDEDLKAHKSIEVGHIFSFGTKYTQSMDAAVMDSSGSRVFPHCGSYGIGVSRLAGAIIEVSHDDKGIIWPVEVAPFKLALINLHPKDADSTEKAENLYLNLKSKTDVLYDDTSAGAGSKLSSYELIGIPFALVLSSNLARQNQAEFRNRKTGEVKIIPFDSVMQFLSVNVL